jgi:hypothetical protein
MKLTELFSYCFDKWWRPVIFFGLTAGLFILSDLSNRPAIHDLFFLLFAVGLLGLIISSIYQFTKGRWLSAIFTTFIIGLSIVGFFFYSVALFWKMQSEPDTYADNLKIPTNIQINLPLDGSQTPTVSGTDFFIHSSFQPGLYQYEFWTKRIEKGKIYFKAFEITNNDPLSAERLKERSQIEVYNPTDTLMQFLMDKGNSDLGMPFTIYEGDFGKPYAAKFELWFIPSNGGFEKMLAVKNYKIEGWQR